MHKMPAKPTANSQFLGAVIAAPTRTSGTLWPSFSPSGRLDDLWVSLIVFHHADI